MTPAMEKYKHIYELSKQLVQAQRDVEKASARRRDLPAGSSRAKVTTANARWSTAAEERDRIWGALRSEFAMGGSNG